MFVFSEFLDLLFEVVDKDVIFFLHFMDGVGHFCCLVVVVKQHLLHKIAAKRGEKLRLEVEGADIGLKKDERTYLKKEACKRN